MSELSLMEMDAQFGELLPEREALGTWGQVHIPCHDYNPCQPHHHCEPKQYHPKPCEPRPCEPKPCDSQPAPCEPVYHHPCGDDDGKDLGYFWGQHQHHHRHFE
jgi:hypothetical protein